MFESLPHTFRSHGVPADVRALLTLRQSMDKGLANTLGDLYAVLKAIVVKDPAMEGPYTKAFYDYFLAIDIQRGEKLAEAVGRSVAFRTWKQALAEQDAEQAQLDQERLVGKFLDEVHLTTYDIRQMMDGQAILDKDNPDMVDQAGQQGDGRQERPLGRAADYSQTSLQDLLRRMERVAQQQKHRHHGGSHWIGTGGISPYGHSGAAKGGIRVGGQGGGRMARQAIDDPRFFPVDMDQRLSDDNIDAALAALKGVFEASATAKLDLPNTIKNGLKRGGLFLPEQKDEIEEKMRVILLVDNGGYSMDPHIRPVAKLFKKMKTRFAHDMETYYFHNTLYHEVATDERRTQRISVEKLLAHDPGYSMFIVGDAAMAPYELSQLSIQNWMRVKDKFKRVAWLNPERQRYWDFTQTTHFLRQIFHMFPLTPKGIEQAVAYMNRAKKSNSI